MAVAATGVNSKYQIPIETDYCCLILLDFEFWSLKFFNVVIYRNFEHNQYIPSHKAQ